MDFDASGVLTGESTLAQAGESLGRLAAENAAGELSKPERLRYREYFIMYKHQDTPGLEAGCRA